MEELLLEDIIANMRQDARHLRIAAKILKRNSAKPRSFMLAVLCKTLRNCADSIDRDADNVVNLHPPWPD